MADILIIDDEKSIRTALGTLIDWQSLDCEVVYMARSGQDVLKSSCGLQSAERSLIF